MKAADEFAIARVLSRMEEIIAKLEALLTKVREDDPEALELADRHIRARAGANGYRGDTAD